MDDYRIKTSWRSHRKRKRLRRALGADGVLAIEDLWSYAASSRPDGDLSGMTDEDIAIEVDYPGDPAELVQALAGAGLIDGIEGSYRLHDWCDHQPYVASHSRRKDAARKAAEARWASRGQPRACAPHADRMRTACGSHKVASKYDAPDPSPSPDPSPDPSPAHAHASHAHECDGTAGRLREAFGRLLSSAESTRLRELQPVTAAELDHAIEETRAKASRPNVRYCLGVIESARRPLPAGQGTGPPAAPRLSRVEQSIQAAMAYTEQYNASLEK